MVLVGDGIDGGGGDGGGTDGRPPKLIPKSVGAEGAAQQLASVRHLKNSLVGDEKAKRSALALSVVQDILTFLDAAAAAAAAAARGGDGSGGQHYESALLHGIGLLVILCSPPLQGGLAEMYIAPSGSRIVGYIVEGLKMTSSSSNNTSRGSACDRSSGYSSSSDKLTATALRAISSMCSSVVPISKYQDGLARDAAASAARGEREASLDMLRNASALILNEVVSIPEATATRRRECWSPALKTLGLEALAAVTRVEVCTCTYQILTQ